MIESGGHTRLLGIRPALGERERESESLVRNTPENRSERAADLGVGRALSGWLCDELETPIRVTH